MLFFFLSFVTVRSPKDAECIITEFHDYSFGENSNLKVKLALSSEEKERRREVQQEEEKFYQDLYKNTVGGGKEISNSTGTSAKEISCSTGSGAIEIRGSTMESQRCLFSILYFSFVV